MLKLLCIVFSLFLSSVANSTGQIKDEFKIEKTTFRIKEQPLIQMIETDKITKIVKDDTAGKYDLIYHCSANHRGFKVIWRLYKNELYIDSIIKYPCDKFDIELEAKLVFPESKDYPIKASWFNGDISTKISAREYVFGKYTFDLLVYTFVDGKLVSRYIEEIKE